MQKDLKIYLQNYNKLTDRKLNKAYLADPKSFSRPILLNIGLDKLKEVGINNPFLEFKKGCFWLSICEPSIIKGETILTHWIDIFAKKYQSSKISAEDLRDAITDKLIYAPAKPNCTICSYNPNLSSFSTFLNNIALSCVADYLKSPKYDTSNIVSLDITVPHSDKDSTTDTYLDIISDNLSAEDEYFYSPKYLSSLLNTLEDTNETLGSSTFSYRDSFIPKFKFNHLGIASEYFDAFPYLKDLDFIRLTDRVMCLLYLNNLSFIDLLGNCFNVNTCSINSDYVDFDTWVKLEAEDNLASYIESNLYGKLYINPISRSNISKMINKSINILRNIINSN